MKNRLTHMTKDIQQKSRSHIYESGHISILYESIHVSIF